MTAVQAVGMALYYVPEALRKNDICIAAVHQTGWALEFVPKTLRAWLLENREELFPLTCPETGAFTAWKKCHDDAIVKLFVPEDARRSSAYGKKCRCDKATVVSITGKDGSVLQEARSIHKASFV